MELYLGKKFKLEVWETCIKSMRLNEVASFTVEPHVRLNICLKIWSKVNCRVFFFQCKKLSSFGEEVSLSEFNVD